MNIRELRKKLGISQGFVADSLKIPRTTYANYENRVCDPSIDILIKIANFFNVSLDELVERKTDMVNLNLLDDTRKALIKEIINTSDVTVARLDAFYQGIKLAELEREEIVKKIKR